MEFPERTVISFLPRSLQERELSPEWRAGGGRQWLGLRRRLAVSQELLNSHWINVCQEQSLPGITTLSGMPADSFRAFKLVFICLISLTAPVPTLSPLLCRQKGASTSSPSSLAAGAQGKAVLCGGKGSAPALPGQPRRSWAPSKLQWTPPACIPAHWTATDSLLLGFFMWPRTGAVPANHLEEQRDFHKTPSCCCLTNPVKLAGCKSHSLDFSLWAAQVLWGEPESYTADSLPQTVPKLWYLSCGLGENQHWCCRI